MPSITLYADTFGKLFADTASNRTQVIFTYTTAGSRTGFTPNTYAGPLEIPSTVGGLNVTSVFNYIIFYYKYIIV